MGRFLLCALAVLALGGAAAEASVDVVLQDGGVHTGESITHSDGLYFLDQGSRGVLTIPEKLVREVRAPDIIEIDAELVAGSAVIVELQQIDKTGQSSQEIERIRNLVSQAQAFLAAEKLKEIDPALERSAALAAIVRARSDRIVAEQEADKVEAAAQRTEKEAQEARAAADAAQQKYDELEARGL